MHCRISDLLDTQRKLETEVDGLKKYLHSSEKNNQNLIDEHDALNKAFNALQTKLKKTEAENDRLVSCNGNAVVEKYTVCHRNYCNSKPLIDVFIIYYC